MRSLIVLIFAMSIFTGCGPSQYASITPKNSQEYNQKLQKAFHFVKNLKKQGYIRTTYLPVEEGRKVFFMNVHPSEEKRAKQMFDFAIKAMRDFGLCYYDEKNQKSICVQHPDVKILKEGEVAELALESLEGKMDKGEAYEAILQFNQRYFPGFSLLDPEALIKVFSHLKIYNGYLDDKTFKQCYITGYMEEFLEKNKNVLVDDTDEADVIILYQSLACNDRYYGYQPKSLLSIIEENNQKLIEGSDQGLKLKKTGTLSLISAISYSKLTCKAFQTYWTPTVITGITLSFFIPTYATYSGVAYEALIIDKEKKAYADIARKSTWQNGSFYTNHLDWCSEVVAHKIVTGRDY